MKFKVVFGILFCLTLFSFSAVVAFGASSTITNVGVTGQSASETVIQWDTPTPEKDTWLSTLNVSCTQDTLEALLSNTFTEQIAKTRHKVWSISNPNSTICYKVKDSNGNSTAIYQQVVPGSSALVMSNINSQPTSNSVTITWDTNLPANTLVYVVPALGNFSPQYYDATITFSDDTLTTNHHVVINGLAANTGYLFVIESFDNNKNFVSNRIASVLKRSFATLPSSVVVGSLPDLTIDSVTFIPWQSRIGETVTINVVVKNLGDPIISDKGTKNWITSVYDFSWIEGNGALVPSRVISSSNPLGTNQTIIYSGKGFFMRPGIKTYGFQVDSLNELAESEERNNGYNGNPAFQVIVLDAINKTINLKVEDAVLVSGDSLPIYWSTDTQASCSFKGATQPSYISSAATSQAASMVSVPSNSTDGKYHYKGTIQFIPPTGDTYYQITCTTSSDTAVSDIIKLKRISSSAPTPTQSVVPVYSFSDIKPGWLVKNKKYAEVFYVDTDRKLHWIINEKAALKHFGPTWNQVIKEFDDLSASGLLFSTNLD